MSSMDGMAKLIHRARNKRIMMMIKSRIAKTISNRVNLVQHSLPTNPAPSRPSSVLVGKG